MTTDMIKGIAIGVCIGFIIPIVIYLFLKRMEPKNIGNHGIPEMKNIPPCPPKKDRIENHPIISRHYSIIDNELKSSPKCSRQNPESRIRITCKLKAMPEIKETTILYNDITELMCDAVNRMNRDLKIASFEGHSQKLRIAIPEPLLKMLKDEFHERFKIERKIDNEGYFRFMGIRIIENYQFNITIFHVDWYSWNNKELVQSFEIKQK